MPLPYHSFILPSLPCLRVLICIEYGHIILPSTDIHTILLFPHATVNNHNNIWALIFQKFPPPLFPCLPFFFFCHPSGAFFQLHACKKHKYERFEICPLCTIAAQLSICVVSMCTCTILSSRKQNGSHCIQWCIHWGKHTYDLHVFC